MRSIQYMNDNQRLLRESAMGLRCACESIAIAKKYARDKKMRDTLSKYLTEHRSLYERARTLLGQSYPKGTAMPLLMTKVHTGISLSLRNDSPRVADLMLNGCNMGMKSVASAKNKNPAATAEAITVANEIIRTEEAMHREMLKFVR